MIIMGKYFRVMMTIEFNLKRIQKYISEKRKRCATSSQLL